MPELDELPPLLPQAPLKPGTPLAPEPLSYQRAEPARFEPRPGDLDEGEARLPQAPLSLDEPKPGELPKELTPLDEELRRAAELMQSEPTVFGLPSILGHIKAGSDVHAMSFSLNALILVGAGLLLGAAGSGLTLRRFLRV